MLLLDVTLVFSQIWKELIRPRFREGLQRLIYQLHCQQSCDEFLKLQLLRWTHYQHSPTSMMIQLKFPHVPENLHLYDHIQAPYYHCSYHKTFQFHFLSIPICLQHLSILHYLQSFHYHQLESYSILHASQQCFQDVPRQEEIVWHLHHWFLYELFLQGSFRYRKGLLP